MHHNSEFILASEFSESVNIKEHSEEENQLSVTPALEETKGFSVDEIACSYPSESPSESCPETNQPDNVYAQDSSGVCNYTPKTPYQFFQGISGPQYTEITLLPSSQVMHEVIYVDPTLGTVNLKLGDRCQPYFAPGSTVTVKDVSLQFGSGSLFNINIIPPGDMVLMEYYHSGILGVGKEFGYAINSDGGSVTFRYNAPFQPGMYPCWTIDHQFIGNVRGTNNAVFLKVPTSCAR